jgi:cell division septum initiation protein DivIVA
LRVEWVPSRIVAADASGSVDPDTILQRSFTSVRRGYDPLEVQKFLMALAGEMRASRERERELRRRLDEAERNVEELSEMSPSRLAALLGEETARVLEAANVAAGDIGAKAEEAAAALLRDAQDQAARLRSEAASVLDRKTREAEEAADAVRRQGDEELQRARAEADQEVEAGRQRGREMVTEAQRVRERMLRDLARRRRLLRQQIEQLQAGRDRLVVALEVVRGRVDEATAELDVAVPEAKAAAEVVGQQIDEEAMQETLEQDLAELTAEVEAGLSLQLDRGPDDGGEPRSSPAAAADQPEPASEPASAEPVDRIDAQADSDEPGGPGAGDDEGPPASKGSASTKERAKHARDERPSRKSRAVKRGSSKAAPATASEVGEGRHEDEAEGGDASGERQSSTVRVIRSKSPESPESPGHDDEVVPTEATGENGANGAGATPDSAKGSSSKVAGLFDRIKQEADQADGTGRSATAASASAATEGKPADDESEPQSLVGRRDQAVADLERTVARRLKRELSDEQNELLDAIRREKTVPTFEAAVPAPEDHMERYATAARASLVAAAKAGAAFVGGRSSDDAPATQVDDLTAELAAEVVAPLRDRIDRCFTDAGDDPDELAERLRAHYREWKLQRIDGWASYAVLAAFNRGLLDTCDPSTKVHWVLDDPDAPSPDCEDNALAGNIACGESFPTGHVAPPAHPACRCLVVPAGLAS